MKINIKKSMSILVVSYALLFQGCGGGGSGGGNGGDGKGKDELPAGKTFKYNRISVAGSSITWGQGYLGEKSYVGKVIEYFRQDLANTINPTELKKQSYDDIITEPYSYQGELIVYNEGSQISGTLQASEEIVIVYGGSSATVKMEVDGKVCGTKTISGNFKPVKVTTPTNDVDTDTGNVRSFRETEPMSVAKICKNLENKKHTFKLTVTSGELHLNFITNHMYYFQNAGIGGYAASTLLGGANAWFPNTTTDEIVDFNPDFFIFESATNDAQKWEDEEKAGYTGTNNWKQESPISFSIVKDKPNQIELSQSPSKPVEVGDVVVMGSYNGVNANVTTLAVGIVADVDSRIITLEDNVPTTVEKMCKIKSIKAWEDNVKEVIRRVKDGVGHSVSVGIGTSGVPNYYPPSIAGNLSRRLMGYREKGMAMARENNWMFFDFFNKVKAFNPGVDTNGEWSLGDNTHPRGEGYRLFGEAITDVLKQQ